MSKFALTEQQYRVDRICKNKSLRELSRPFIRKFPNPYFLRKVEVSLRKHHYSESCIVITLKQEDNPIWDHTYWTYPYNDDLGIGLTHIDLVAQGEERLLKHERKYTDTIVKALKVVTQNFPNHEIVWYDYCKKFEKPIDMNALMRDLFPSFAENIKYYDN